MPRWVFYFLLILAAPAVAQDCTQTIPVRVVDTETAAPIEPLTAEMITAKMGETHLLISSPARIRAGRIIVLIDESESMAGAGLDHRREAVRAVKLTLGELMTKLPPGVSIEYGLFKEKWVLSGTFLSDPAEVRKSIDEVTASFGKSPYGRTAIYDSLHEALRRLGPPQIGDSILLLTDGGDNSSKLTAKKLELEFHAGKARLLTMMLFGTQVSPAEESGRDSVQELVLKTGGSTLAINPETPAWADPKSNLRTAEVVRRFWNERVLSTDVMQVQVPGTLTKEAKWKLTVNREVDARLKNAIVIYPTWLSPCPAATASAH